MRWKYRAWVYFDAAGEWRWRITARNGRIVADSGEGYTRKSAAVAAVRKIIIACSAGMVDRRFL